MTTTQLPLIPVNPLHQVNSGMMPVDQLPATSVEAGAALEGSVKKLGVLVYLMVLDEGEGSYVVMDGKRRLAAARKAGLAEVPCDIFEGDMAPEAMTLVTNTQRSRNLAGEARAIEQLIARGYSEAGISRELGISPGQQRRLLKLRGLSPVLREAFEAGRMSSSAAERAAIMPRAAQAGLEALFMANGRVTGPDVHEQAQVRAREAFSAIQDQFPGLEPAAAPEPESWRAQAVTLLDRLVGLLPTTEADIIQQAATLRDSIAL